MRKGVLISVLIGLSFLMGCTSGVVKSGDDRVNSFRQSVHMDSLQIIDDWDMLWMVDRQTKLSRWQIR